ncbi:hydroxymethylbilane synthase [Flavobacteriaceae bacterium UJ101]|nr:hydroxymethylbilane synthase [Flavobacteriaceae bacterium UJ101]
MQTIRIGTRDSQLAMWQAETVQKKLENLGYLTQIVAVKSQGDKELTKPLYEMGITGVFTKVLDIALLEKRIDIAVHSLKDVPTALPKGTVYGAFLERGSYEDIIVYKGNDDFLKDYESKGTIATSSLRRKAAWLNKFPNYTIENLRGNVNSRLKKLQASNWKGAVFAKAGLERIHLLEKLPEMGLNYRTLDWMISAPAQGIVTVTCLEENKELFEACQKINNPTSEIEATVERDFLKKLEGGCTAPIGAKATVRNNIVDLTTSLYSLDGKICNRLDLKSDVKNYKSFGIEAGETCITNGGKELMKSIRDFND